MTADAPLPMPPRPVPPHIARKRRLFPIVSALFLVGVGALMLSAAANAAWWVDTVLLGLGGVVISGFALVWQTRLIERTRNGFVALLALACSPLTIYPLGALIALRFLIFPADGFSQGVGIAAGLLFLSPILFILAIALMFVLGKAR